MVMFVNKKGRNHNKIWSRSRPYQKVALNRKHNAGLEKIVKVRLDLVTRVTLVVLETMDDGSCAAKRLL